MLSGFCVMGTFGTCAASAEGGCDTAGEGDVVGGVVVEGVWSVEITLLREVGGGGLGSGLGFLLVC